MIKVLLCVSPLSAYCMRLRFENLDFLGVFGPVLQVVTPHKRNTGVEPQLSPAVAGLPRVRLPGPGCDKKDKETPAPRPPAETCMAAVGHPV